MGLGGVKKEWGTTSKYVRSSNCEKAQPAQNDFRRFALAPSVALAASNRPITEPKTLAQGDGTIVITA